jgi:regulator of sirC expression with transglutaminase-like and TPR domain
MVTPLRFTPPTPLDYFGALVAEEASIPLTEAAIALGQDDYPGLDVQRVLAQIDQLARTLRLRVPPDAVPVQRLRWLNRFFFQELGFGGNVNDYYDPDNSFLHRVLETRRGIPISLAVLYIELANQLGLRARGVSFPGHFLIKLRIPNGEQQGEVVIDPFNGASLSREELDERLHPYRQQQGLAPGEDIPLGLFLQSATARAVLARMLRNLKEIHRGGGDSVRLLSVCQRLVLLLPEDATELRDRGLAAVQTGRDDLAAADLRLYLDHHPDAVDREEIETRLRSLGGLRRSASGGTGGAKRPTPGRDPLH